MSKCISLKSEVCENRLSQQKYLVIMDVLSGLQVKAELYNYVADLNEVHQRWKSQNTNLKGIIGYYSYTKRFNITFNPLKRRVKTHLPFGGIIRSSPHFPR